jgi:uncharacterized membrane protein YeaQ/YmgE (transglycosylase-associated protein family)
LIKDFANYAALMDPSGIFSALFSGIVVGVLARFITPGINNIGCLLTILIGIVGAVAGLALGSAWDAGFWLTFALQIVIAALLVAVFSALTRVRR